MDEADLTVKPFKAPAGEENAVRVQVKKQLRCVVVVPKKAANGNPWTWRGYYFDHEPQAEIALLKRGFHVGFIWCDAGKPWDAWYKFLTETHGLSKKPAFIGMSRGGWNAYTWAAANPDKVSCIYADNPAVSREALAALGDTGQGGRTRAPRLRQPRPDPRQPHPCRRERLPATRRADLGDDQRRGRSPSAQPARPQTDRRLYRALHATGQRKRPGVRRQGVHQDRVLRNRRRLPRVPERENVHHLPRPVVRAVLRPLRVPTRRHPHACHRHRAADPAPGKPWVFRADFVTREATVDLALLGRGFHVVTGPVPTDTDGPVLQQWNAVYKHLTEHGLSKKPVLEGSGGAAGEAYAWAIENPDKVSCIYVENPILRSHMTKAQPLDRLGILAKAKVRVIHFCGSRDPWLQSQTRVLQKRYEQLGGLADVVVEEGKGHFPLAPRDPKPFVEIIVARQVPVEPAQAARTQAHR